MAETSGRQSGTGRSASKARMSKRQREDPGAEHSEFIWGGVGKQDSQGAPLDWALEAKVRRRTVSSGR